MQRPFLTTPSYAPPGMGPNAGLGMMNPSIRREGLGGNSTSLLPATCELRNIRAELGTKNGTVVDIVQLNSTHATVIEGKVNPEDPCGLLKNPNLNTVSIGPITFTLVSPYHIYGPPFVSSLRLSDDSPLLRFVTSLVRLDLIGYSKDPNDQRIFVLGEAPDAPLPTPGHRTLTMFTLTEDHQWEKKSIALPPSANDIESVIGVISNNFGTTIVAESKKDGFLALTFKENQFDEASMTIQINVFGAGTIDRLHVSKTDAFQMSLTRNKYKINRLATDGTVSSQDLTPLIEADRPQDLIDGLQGASLDIGPDSSTLSYIAGQSLLTHHLDIKNHSSYKLSNPEIKYLPNDWPKSGENEFVEYDISRIAEGLTIIRTVVEKQTDETSREIRYLVIPSDNNPNYAAPFELMAPKGMTLVSNGGYSGGLLFMNCKTDDNNFITAVYQLLNDPTQDPRVPIATITNISALPAQSTSLPEGIHSTPAPENESPPTTTPTPGSDSYTQWVFVGGAIFLVAVAALAKQPKNLLNGINRFLFGSRRIHPTSGDDDRLEGVEMRVVAARNEGVSV